MTDEDKEHLRELEKLLPNLTPDQRDFFVKIWTKRRARAESYRDVQVCLDAIGESDSALKYTPPEFWDDSAFCLEAVKRNGEALAWVNEKLLTPELCRAAVLQNGVSLDYVPDPLRTVELCVLAAQVNGMALEFVPRMRFTKEIIQTAVRQNRYALAFVPDIWREEAKAALQN